MDREWIVLVCFKYVLVVLLPFYLAMGPIYSYASVLFSFGSEAGSYIPYSGSSVNIFLLAFIAVLTLPALLFDYTAHHRPKDRSVTKLFILVFILLNPYVQVFSITPVMMALPAALGGYSELYSMISQAAVYAIIANTWALPLMVVIPFFMRQVSDLNQERAHASHIFNQYNLLAIILGISIFMMPILVTNMNIYSYSPYRSAAENLILLSGGAMFQITLSTSSLSLIFTTIIFMNLMTLQLAAALYTLFIHDILEYLKMRTSRARCIGTGIIATLGSVLATMGTYPGILLNPNLQVYPLPTIFVMGLIVMLRAGQVEVTEGIWDKEPDKLWYEKNEPTSEGGGRGEVMKVPVKHLIRARLAGAKKQENKYDWDHKNEDVFGRGTESHTDS